MTYEEAIDLMKDEMTQMCLIECSSFHRGEFSECGFCKQAEMMDTAIKALENCPPKEARCYGCKDDCRICALGMW